MRPRFTFDPREQVAFYDAGLGSLADGAKYLWSHVSGVAQRNPPTATFADRLLWNVDRADVRFVARRKLTALLDRLRTLCDWQAEVASCDSLTAPSSNLNDKANLFLTRKLSRVTVYAASKGGHPIIPARQTLAIRSPWGGNALTLRRCLLLVSITSIFAETGIVRAQDAERAPDTMAARVLACASCHGDKGQGTNDDYFPRLAGKPAGYLYNQLVAFRDGRRKYPPMNYLLEFLPDPYLKAMADYFASEQPPFPPPATPTVSGAILSRGEILANKGDAAHEIPACANCHGPSFTGMEPAIPGLLGLRTNYISAQLGAWRYGTRTAAAPDCMQIVAGHLTEDDVKALAAWLSSRPTPANPTPAPRGSLPMPLACGSEPN